MHENIPDSYHAAPVNAGCFLTLLFRDMPGCLAEQFDIAQVAS